MPPRNMSRSTVASLRCRACSRIGRIGAFLGLATATLALAGCQPPRASTATADDPEVRPNELTDAGGRPCPRELPLGEDPSGHGFGTEKGADEFPTLLEPQDAWVCQYNTFDIGTTPSGGTTYEWRRAGQPDPVGAPDLPELELALSALEPADRRRPCTADLGPRWMVVYSHHGDLTGVVVDDYGCRDVRLTDNPHSTASGSADQNGIVGGVLDGGAAILDALGVGRSN
jgi:hypothetical protein